MKSFDKMCRFCGNEDDLKQFKNKYICKECRFKVNMETRIKYYLKRLGFIIFISCMLACAEALAVLLNQFNRIIILNKMCF